MRLNSINVQKFPVGVLRLLCRGGDRVEHDARGSCAGEMRDADGATAAAAAAAAQREAVVARGARVLHRHRLRADRRRRPRRRDRHKVRVVEGTYNTELKCRVHQA